MRVRTRRVSSALHFTGECSSLRMVIVDLPEQPLAPEGEGAEVALAVRVVVLAEIGEARHGIRQGAPLLGIVADQGATPWVVNQAALTDCGLVGARSFRRAVSAARSSSLRNMAGLPSGRCVAHRPCPPARLG